MTTLPSCDPFEDSDSSAALNHHCRCITVNEALLSREIETDLAEPELYGAIRESRPHLFSPTAVFVARADIERMRAIVTAIEHVVGTSAYRVRALSWADNAALFDPG